MPGCSVTLPLPLPQDGLQIQPIVLYYGKIVLRRVFTMIVAVGLGYTRDDISARGKKAVRAAGTLFVKTLKSPAGRALKRYAPQSFDELFETSADFGELYRRAADRLVACPDGAVYATDGVGRDGVVAELIARGVEVEVIPGAVDASGLTVTATDAVTACPYLDTLADLTVTEIDDPYLAGELKLRLFRFYAPETPCLFSANGKTRPIALAELDRQKGYGVSAALKIAGSAALDKPVACFGDLLRVMDRLTAPDGCPWDKAQTHESIRQNLIEEAYEAVDAIDARDTDGMTEELGDVILQAVFHCNIAERTGEFELADVLSGLCHKLYTRHTHIFGSVKATGADEALVAWEQAKSVEKKYESLYDILSRLPKGFPSALKIGKAVKKAVKMGADVTAEPMTAEKKGAVKAGADVTAEPVTAEKKGAVKVGADSTAEKLTAEAVAALNKGDRTTATFDLIAASALLGEEPETALNRAAEAFIERFKD